MDIAVLLLSMCLFFAIGMPIAYALALSALVGALWIDLPVGAVMQQFASGVGKVSMLTIPFFVLAQSLSLIDTYPAMVLALVAINQPFTIWLMRSFFVDVPYELDEAATIDGCNLWQIFYRVALPVVRPGLWVTALFSLLLAYNEFLFALVLTGPNTKTLPVAIAEYGAEDLNYWSLSAAAAIGIMLPIVLFMMALQRHLVRGLAFGAVKG